ncbi:MAG: GDYXXLXY domain-containing protein [Woeseiaceae bacterium]|nr:GDYXXLXY domain-containing protein [Woeseiaceae bacterium]
MRNRAVVRTAVLFATAALILVVVNIQIVGKERIVQSGTTVLLPLAPRDPRSLLQGDYMALRYAMAGDVGDAARAAGVTDGAIVVELGDDNVARFAGLHDGRPLAARHHLLRFRKRGDTVRLASDAFFFEEGEGASYRDARYGELRVDADGAAVLVGLRDADGMPLVPGSSGQR